MTKSMKLFGALLGVALVYNLDVITGYWKFYRLCSTEVGSRFQGPIEPGVGWEAESAETSTPYKMPLFMGASFARFRNERGELVDARPMAPPGPIGGTEYFLSPADQTLSVRYYYRYERHPAPEDNRFSWTNTVISDAQTKTLLAKHTSLAFAWSTPSRMILNMPSPGATCPDPSSDDWKSFILKIRNSKGITP